jgi:hypothetical protein
MGGVGGQHGLHPDGGGVPADGQRREAAAYVRSGEAELLAKAMWSETAALGLDSSPMLAADAACQGPMVDGRNINRWKKNVFNLLLKGLAKCVLQMYPTLILVGNKLDGQD